MTPEIGLLAAAVYVVLGRWIVAGLRGVARDALFALLNLGAVYLFFFWRKQAGLEALLALFFIAYIAIVTVQYLALRAWSGRRGWWPWAAFLLPIAVLAFMRYAPIAAMARPFSSYIYNVLRNHPEISLGWAFVGISYLAFRTSYLVLEVRNGTTPMPSYWQYLHFVFFAPTMSVGPINPYHQHRRGFIDDERERIPVGRALMRILVGAVKYRFFAQLLNFFTYSGLLLDGHPHVWIDLPIAIVAYYLYLYCNFSGFVDMAIGAAGLIGIPVAENFDNPFAARNVKDFWNRWHITLSHYMRDVVFAPLSKSLVRRFGPPNANHAIAVTIMVVFLIVGIWHGAGWNYAAFGAMHGIGVVANHYYTIWLKKRLGRDRFAAYNRSRVIHWIAVVCTFSYVALSLFLFANSGTQMRQIFSMLRLHAH